MKDSTRIRLVLLSLSIVLPPLALLFYIDAFGVNVIFWDEWVIVPLIQKGMNGSLGFSDFFDQHMEHRLLFPRIAMLTISKFTQYNTRAEMFFSWTLICMTMLLIFHLYWKKSLKDKLHRVLLTFLPVSLLFFSFIQYETILWGFSCQTYMMIFGAVASFYLLNMSKKIDYIFGLSILCAILASFSFFLGLLVWPAAFLQLMLEEKRNIKKIISWSIIGSSTIMIYFHDFFHPSEAPSLTYFLTYPLASAQYFFSLLGAPLSRSVLGSRAFGLFIFLITIIVLILNYKEKSLRKDRVWIALILFIGLSAIAITVGRGGFGLKLALSSRYTPIIILGIISVYLLAMVGSDRHPTRLRNFAAHAMLTLILVTLITTYGYGLDRGREWKYSRDLGSYILTTYEIQSYENIRKYLYPNPDHIQDRMEFCDQEKLSSFAETKVDATVLILQNSSTLSSIESINDKEISRHTGIVIDLEKENTITIEGWAIDQPNGKVASDVFIIVDNQFDIPTHYGLERSDVSSHLNNSDYRYSGFIATFSSSIFSKELHSISLKVVSNNGEFYYYPHEIYVINFK
jgi:hypothetical protein